MRALDSKLCLLNPSPYSFRSETGMGNPQLGYSSNLAMRERKISAMSGCTALAARCTSSWLTSTIFPGTPKSVMMLTPKVRMPQWWATMTSGTVLMPTASAPKVRYMRYSAGVS